MFEFVSIASSSLALCIYGTVVLPCLIGLGSLFLFYSFASKLYTAASYIMRFSQRIVGALSLVSLVAAAPLEKRDVVTVKLTEAGNALVEATISNTGASAISLLKRGTILNDNGLERKTIVSKDGTITLVLDRTALTQASQEPPSPSRVSKHITTTRILPTPTSSPSLQAPQSLRRST